jgi:hypothetical protein
LCPQGLHVVHFIIVVNANLIGRHWVAGGLSGFQIVSLTWQMSGVSSWLLLAGVIRFPRGVGDFRRRMIGCSIWSFCAVSLGGMVVPHFRVLSTGELQRSRSCGGTYIFWSLLSTAWSRRCELSLCILFLGWTPEDWGMVAAIVAYVTGVVEGSKIALRCLWVHVGYSCPVSPHP